MKHKQAPTGYLLLVFPGATPQATHTGSAFNCWKLSNNKPFPETPTSSKREADPRLILPTPRLVGRFHDLFGWQMRRLNRPASNLCGRYGAEARWPRNSRGGGVSLNQRPSQVSGRSAGRFTLGNPCRQPFLTVRA